jgi:CheY-like chemotaxis protein
MCPDENDKTEEAPTSSDPLILLVENEVLVRMSLAMHLRDSGFTVLEAASGDEAQTIFLSGAAIDLVFSDIDMQGPHDGIELAIWVAQHFPETPVILTSGAPNAKEAVTSSGAKIVAFVPKPYQDSAVEALLRKTLPKRIAR